MSDETLNKALDRIVVLESELAEARKDGERLAYAEEHRLDMRHRSMFEPGQEHWEIVTAHTHPMHRQFFKGKTLREAIDNATAARGTR